MADTGSRIAPRKAQRSKHVEVPGFTPNTLSVQAELDGAPRANASWESGGLKVSAHRGRDGFWIVVRKPGHGGIALRSFPIMGEYRLSPLRRNEDGGVWKVETNTGTLTITLQLLDDGLLRIVSRLKPAQDLLVAFWPRDCYPLDNDDNPCKVNGRVEAGQRGLNAGFCYFHLDRPKFGSVFYMQNFSALNDFFAVTRTKPDGVVGGLWPELGYQPPAAPMANTPPRNPLTAGKEVVISDVLVSIRNSKSGGEFDSARDFVEMLAGIYPHLDKPKPANRDWLWRAEKTLNDLKTSPDVYEMHFGHKYLRPYVAAEVPDSMVQMTVVQALHSYQRARGTSEPFFSELAAGMDKFFDNELGTIRRYLPGVSRGKDADAVDAWYLYHPLMNLGRLALAGEAWADTLFRKSLAFAVKVARHFRYRWPISYKMTDLSVICQDRGDGLGQTDVGGMYAYVMLLAHELTGDGIYLKEAKAALKASEDMRFELVYQTNLTGWGLLACVKAWKLEGDTHYRDQAMVFLSGILHNCELWSSRLGWAKNYANFFGVTCLHDGPYMAAYEAFEVFAAFDEALVLASDDLPDAARLLMSEYCRYAFDVLWSFYPDALPPAALSETVRNGHIDRALSLPLEDIYGDGSPAGKIGQEVYGAGSAFILASHVLRSADDKKVG